MFLAHGTNGYHEVLALAQAFEIEAFAQGLGWNQPYECSSVAPP